MFHKQLLTFLCCLASGPIICGAAVAQEVGQTIARCDPPQNVSFAELSRQTLLPPGARGTFNLNGRISGFYWYCDGDRNYVRNSRLFNAVRVVRSGGEIRWTFLDLPPNGSQGVYVGRTMDACDRSQPVRIAGRSGTSLIVPRSIRVIELGALERRFEWTCGDDGEVAANDTPFSRIVVGRARNGAIEMQFFTSFSAKTLRTGRYLPASQQDLFVASTAGQPAAQLVSALLPALNQTWTNSLPSIRREALAALRAFPGVISPTTLNIATAANASLRLGSTPNGIRVKYMIPDNSFRTRFEIDDPLADTIFNGTFDIEVVIPLPATTPNLAATPVVPTTFLNKVEIFAGGSSAALSPGRVRAVETDVAALRPEIGITMATTVGALLNNAPGIPFVPPLPATFQLRGGVLNVCITTGPGTCPLPVPRVAATPLNHLQTKAGRCGRPVAWFWDDELAEYVPVAKGQRRQIQLSNSFVPWACGDAVGPDFTNGKEFTEGPTRARRLAMSRAPTSDRMGLRFLD